MRKSDKDLALVYELSDEKIELSQLEKRFGGISLIEAGMRLQASREDMDLVLKMTGCKDTPEEEEESA